MSIFSQNNKRANETFLVAGTNDTTVPNLGTALVNSSTGAINLNDGQIGFFAAYPFDGGSVLNFNTTLNHTTTYSTIANAPWIQIYQGTADSANPGASTARYPLFPRPFEASQVIKGSNNLVVTKQAPVDPTLSTWVIGAAMANAEITALDNTEYGISIAYRGRMMDELYSPEATNHMNHLYTTPNYTTLATAEPTDHLLQNLAWNINRNSMAVAVNRTKYRGSEPVVALLVQSLNSPSDGVAIGGVDPIAAGDTIPVVNTTNFGTRSIVLTAQQATSIKNAMIAATGEAIADVDANILEIDLATAGTVTGGVADTIILLALDRNQAYEDRVPQLKVRLDVALPLGFDTTTHIDEYVNASEGQGQGRVLDLWYKATHGQRKYSLDHTMDPVISFTSPIDTADAYYQYTIMHEDVNQVDTGNVVVSPLKEVLLVPDENTTLITAIDNVFGAWVTSANGTGIVTI
jgi:hypothetical protein